ncbi:MAG TPA: primase-helicase family protein, partial [Methanosarcina sp.]|nr:primase-helicase family protein [Methanosarcina sp.]
RHRSGGQYLWNNWGSKISPLPSHLSKKKETRGRPKKDDMYRSKYTIEQVKGMLEFIPADDRDLWRNVGIILGREFKRIDEAWDLYVEWADKVGGKKGRNHDEIMREAFYDLSTQDSEKNLTLGTIVKAAMEGGWVPRSGEVPINHFVYYAPGNNFIYRPTITHWIAAAVDAAVSPVNESGKITSASEWLKQNQLVTSMTCEPSIEDDYTKGVDCRNGEIFKIPGAAMYNTYRRPTIELGDARLAQPFVDHIYRVFNKDGDATQFLDYMAHRVQKPWEKPRFALLISGSQGVGKDTAIEFCCPAIGAWNVANIDPSALEGNFNEHCAAVLIRVSEAANLHEMTKWAFNERMKVLIAGSPDNQTVNPKYGQKFSIRMYCGVIITTNHLSSGIYIPPDDRRYDIIDAATMDEMGLTDADVRKNYFSDLWDWFLEGGKNHVAAYLHERDLTNFSASNGQRKTHAHYTVVAGGLSSDHWLTDIIDDLGRPKFIRSDLIVKKATEEGEKDADVRRKMASAMSRAGYALYRNFCTKDGRWKINGKNRTVYALIGTPIGEDPSGEVDVELF